MIHGRTGFQLVAGRTEVTDRPAGGMLIRFRIADFTGKLEGIPLPAVPAHIHCTLALDFSIAVRTVHRCKGYRKQDTSTSDPVDCCQFFC
jgi:hypothetical protein